MKKFSILLKVLLCTTALFNTQVFGQAPLINYGVSGTQDLIENSAITAYSPTNSGANVTAYYKTPSIAVSGLSSPTDVVIDYYSNVIVGNSASPGGITIYNASNGTNTTIGTALINSVGVNKLKTSQSFEYIYFTTIGSTDIAYYDNASPRNLTTTGVYNLTSPSGIAVDYYSNSLYVIDNGNVYQLSLASPFTKTKVTGIAGTPVRITNAAGALYVLDNLGNLYYIGIGAVASTPLGSEGSSLGSPWFTFDSNNNAYYTVSGNGGTTTTLDKITITKATTIINAAIGTYTGVGIDNSFNIYVANKTTNKLEKYSLVGPYSVSPSLPTGLTLDPATGIISGTPTAYTPATTYTVTAGNQNMFSIGQYYTTGFTTINLTTQPITWLGSDSTFSSTNNWFAGVLPTSNSVITIPSSATFQPALDGDLTVTGIKFTGVGATLDLNGHTLTINGPVSGSGSLKGSTTSSLVIGGNAGTINFATPNNSLKNLTISSGSLTLSDSLNIYGKLVPTNGTFNTGGFLTLKSISSGTAVVESVSGIINGTVNLERYIPQGYMAFRDLSFSVSGVGTFSSTFGKSLSNYKTYTYTKGIWDTLPKTAIPTKCKGYRELITGYKNPIIPSVTRTNMNSPVTLSYSGTLLTGDQSIPLEKGVDTFSFIGNPYASQVDFDALSKTGINDGYWFLDPVNITDSNYEIYNYYGVGLGTSNIFGIAGRFIQPGQAFFVYNQNASSSLTFTESSKNNGSSQVAIFGAATPLNRIATGLFSNGKNLDGAVTVFNSNFSDGISTEDGLKINNPGENLSFSVAGKQLCANGWNIPTVSDVLPIHLYQLNKNKSYALRIDVSQFAANNLQAYLIDNVLNSQTLLSGDSNIVNFTTTTDTSSYNNRYSIGFKVNPLPIKSISITAIATQNNEVAIKWSVIGAIDIVNYQVEHSINGIDFNTIKTILASNSNSFSIIDANPVEGINYYRIKFTDISGNIRYSNSTSIQFSAINSALKVFPNPVIGNKINLKFSKNNIGNFVVRIIDGLGKTVLITSINHASESSIESISIGNHLCSGKYTITATDATGTNILKTQAIIQ